SKCRKRRARIAHGALRLIGSSSLGGVVSRLAFRTSLLLSFCVLMAVFAMSSDRGRLRAQTSPSPTVNVTRMTALNQNVWPGDFTFGTRAALATAALPLDGVAVDLNGDGRKDIAVANKFSQSISVFLNQGSLTFTAADIPIDRHANDVAAAHVNRDGKMDLIV